MQPESGSVPYRQSRSASLRLRVFPRFRRAAPLCSCRSEPAGARANSRLSVSGFTLVELLVLIASICILAILVVPALSLARANSKRTGCLNNLKQMAASAQMYDGDNDGKLAENLPSGRGTNPWVLGNMRARTDSTNGNLIRQGKLFPYARQLAVYRCPADSSKTGGALRVRSYSMNAWIGSRYMELLQKNGVFRTFVRESEILAVSPAALWLLIDEHAESIDDGCFPVTMDDSRPFASFPATRHEAGYALNFADGHAEIYKLSDPASLTLAQEGSYAVAMNPDWLKLKQATTMR
jgi:competence protein ComGC